MVDDAVFAFAVPMPEVTSTLPEEKSMVKPAAVWMPPKSPTKWPSRNTHTSSLPENVKVIGR